MPTNGGRPKPLSCQSCRTKKLKCNRAQPCSNCSARGISCAFLVGPSPSGTNVATRDELLERLIRLEAAVLPSTSSARDEARPQHGRGMGPSALTPATTPLEELQPHEKMSHALENIATREDAVLPSLSIDLEFRICTLDEILGSALPDQHNHERNLPERRIIRFPDFPTATELLQNYEVRAHHACCILHLPSVRAAMKTFYQHLGQNGAVLFGQAALLLSIFAVTAYFCHSSADSTVTASQQGAFNLSKAFSQAALDVMDHSRRNTSCTVEDVQAHVLMAMISFHFDGFSARGRILSTTALSIARDLRLHRLDVGIESLGRSVESPRAFIDREVKRRVFWYVVSTDWLLSAISGPQEGTYFVHPNHIRVHLPKDCTDDELVLLNEDGRDVEPQPTGISYLLQRVKLAHICREMVDLLPPDILLNATPSYDQVVDLDFKLVGFCSELPAFFKMDSESRAQTVQLDILFPALPVLRYSINQAVHSRRCKLHQRFLFRQSIDPRYSYSRHACLESARAVIQSDQDLICPDPPWRASAHRGIATHFKHLAAVILVMDLCLNPDQPDTVQIKSEVKGILDRFEVARHVSPLLDRFLNSLYSVLQKHNIDLDQVPSSLEDPSRVVILSTGAEALIPGVDEVPDEDWLLGFEDGSQMDLSGWDTVFSNLDSRPI